MAVRVGRRVRVPVTVVEPGGVRRRRDAVVAEEPMEIRVQAGGETRTVAVTMRTPGADFELAAGFLYAEGVLAHRADVRSITYCLDRDVDPEQRYNIVNVALDLAALPDLSTLERHFYTTSACGVCGKASLEALEMRNCPLLPPGPTVSPQVIRELPGRMQAAQELFGETGGLHAAALFDTRGELLCLREDVGRHNAVDKLVGWALLNGRLPLHGHILLVSGRSSFEILQKAVVAGIPIVCAISAPSHLAVEVARRFRGTLIGFLRGERFNVYAGDQRLSMPPGDGRSPDRPPGPPGAPPSGNPPRPPM